LSLKHTRGTYIIVLLDSVLPFFELKCMGQSSFKDTPFPSPQNLSPPFFPLSFKRNSGLTVNEKEHQKWEIKASYKSVITLTDRFLFRCITYQ